MKEITDDTQIIRFLDLYGAEKSIGSISNKEIECTFHFGSLRHYQTVESEACDTKEPSVSIILDNGIIASETTGNNALISCWSIWEEKKPDPWISFKGSAFPQNKNNICVIVSTIGKVKKIFQQIISINKLLFTNNFQDIVFDFRDGPVIYYPRMKGLDHNYWNTITDHKKHGLAERTIQCIYHKRDSNESGQSYAAECEYRFSMTLGLRAFFAEKNSDIVITAENLILRDYLLELRSGIHYIEKVYLRGSSQNIRSTCYFSGIDYIEQKVVPA
jgi:hypothetical protein